MVLPLLGSFLMSSMAPALAAGTGMAFLGNPLVAGAVGSGLGSLAQGDSFDEALSTGVMSFMGGKLLSGFGSTPASMARASEFAKGTAGLENLTAQGVTDPNALAAANAKPMYGKVTDMAAGFKGNLPQGIGGAIDDAANIVKANPMAALGSAAGTTLAQEGIMAAKEMQQNQNKTPYQRTETQPYPQNVSFPGQGYVGGVSPEHNYGFVNPMASQLNTQVLKGGGVVGVSGDNYKRIMQKRAEVTQPQRKFVGGMLQRRMAPPNMGSPFEIMGQHISSRLQQNAAEGVGPFVQEVETMAKERFGDDIVGSPTRGQAVGFGGIKGGADKKNQLIEAMKAKGGDPSVGIAQALPFGNSITDRIKKYDPTYIMAEGGAVEVEMSAQEEIMGGNEKDVIVNAVNAIKGLMPEDQAAVALAMFVQEYGKEALESLVDDVRSGEYENVGGKANGMIDGGGDGMSDSVPATIDGQEDLLVSKDEYVVDAPTVSMIGNGSSDAGAKKLDKMREEVRKAATGSRIQPKQIDAEGIMGAALS